MLCCVVLCAELDKGYERRVGGQQGFLCDRSSCQPGVACICLSVVSCCLLVDKLYTGMIHSEVLSAGAGQTCVLSLAQLAWRQVACLLRAAVVWPSTGCCCCPCVLVAVHCVCMTASLWTVGSPLWRGWARNTLLLRFLRVKSGRCSRQV